jgi:hypothetical protein
MRKTVWMIPMLEECRLLAQKKQLWRAAVSQREPDSKRIKFRTLPSPVGPIFQQINRQRRMTMRICVLLLAVFSFCGFAAAQTGPCTVAGIKAAKAAGGEHALPHTADQYFFSGALDKPVIGTSARRQASTTIMASRKNESWTETTERIVTDPSGGMAYEYGTSHMTYDDVKTGQHEDFTVADLRVWKADAGACKVAAEMAEPENTNQPAAKN